MGPAGLAFVILAWAIVAMSAVGLAIVVARRFPRYPWLGSTLFILFLALILLARQTKWMIPLFAILLYLASCFLPRRR